MEGTQDAAPKQGEINLLTTGRKEESELLDQVRERLESNAKTAARRGHAETVAEQADSLSTQFDKIRINEETTEGLKALQDTLDIDEDRIRALQEEAGLSRLHPSRRAEFIGEVLDARIDEYAADQLDAKADEIEAEANAKVDALFGQDPETVSIGFVQRESGGFVTHSTYHEEDGVDPDAVVSVENATTDMSMVGGYLRADVVVLEDDSTVTVDSPAGEQTLVFDRGAWSISHRPLGDLAEEAGLIEREQRKATCTSSDKEALDIEVGRGETETAHVIELKSGNGGYSRRNTKGWTEYRDFDAERNLVLVTVGQASGYKGRFRGKSERTWLVGRDDGQHWAQQVQNPHETIEDALDFMVPAEVKRLESEGREVIRQGDVFFVEMIRSSNFDALDGTRHEIEEHGDKTLVTHPEHTGVELSGEWKAILNIDGSRPRTRRSVARD